ncbi:DoxX family membrane protein [Streptomyces sp. SID8379]|uniref:DoxX family protein n=1 Tax=unclassified Streptomyces TaxID=2593676 RepID=UPI00036A7E63|nr:MULTISPECIES: DoxX family protein [unclassified Streptomyces]MYW64573.1 DoxX family membrane protein [Streptomyces sp. SID8379]
MKTTCIRSRSRTPFRTSSCVDRTGLGLLALRVGTGGVLMAHGAQKLLGWFGGGGVSGTAAAMEAMGFAPPKQSALAAGIGELGGGALLALGLATPVGGAAAAGTMAGAAAVHAPNGFFAQGGGYEYPAFLGFVAAGLAVTGAGRYSLDHALGHALDRHWMVPAALVGAGAAALAVVGSRAKRVKEPDPEA